MTEFPLLGTVIGQPFMQRALVGGLLSGTLGGLLGSFAVLGLLGSGLTNLPSGPCVVIVQFFGFLLALGVSLGRRQRGRTSLA